MNSKCEGCNKLNGMLCPNRGLRKPKYDGCILYSNEEIKEESIIEDEETFDESSTESEVIESSPEVNNDRVDQPIKEETDPPRKLSEEEVKEAKEAQKILREVFSQAYKKMSVYVAVRVLLNQIVTNNIPDEHVDWDHINDLVRNCEDYNECYNIIDPVFHSRDEMEVYMTQNFIAACDHKFAPYRKAVCKDCKKEFTMTQRELYFYLNKKLNIPKRCKECRHKRSVNNV